MDHTAWRTLGARAGMPQWGATPMHQPPTIGHRGGSLAGAHVPSGTLRGRTAMLRCAGSRRAAAGQLCRQTAIGRPRATRCAAPPLITTSSLECRILRSLARATSRRTPGLSTKLGARCAGVSSSRLAFESRDELAAGPALLHDLMLCTSDPQLGANTPLTLPSLATGARNLRSRLRQTRTTPPRRRASSSPPTWACMRPTTAGCLMVGLPLDSDSLICGCSAWSSATCGSTATAGMHWLPLTLAL